MAAEGWDVTCVDIVKKAVRSAERRAETAGVDARFVVGDVTAVDQLGLGRAFDLLIDFSCFHELSDEQRLAAGHAASAVAADAATLLIQVFAPGRRNPMLPRGASREDIELSFTGSTIIDKTAADVSGAPSAVQKAQPCFYRLQRVST